MHRSSLVSSFAAMLTALGLATAGCDKGAGSSGATLADHDRELPTGVESALPFPPEANIMNFHEEDGDVIIIYQPDSSLEEAIEVFSKGFAADGWTITDSNIPGDDEEGEVGAHWDATGHGVEVRAELTGFGGVDTTNVSGTMSIKPAE